MKDKPDNGSAETNPICPFCGSETVFSEAPREMFDDLQDDEDILTCPGNCYIQGVSIPRSQWPIPSNAVASPLFPAWISVTERLPEANAQVIVRHQHGVNEAECWRGNSGRKKTATWDAPYYGQELSHSFEGVTHWMPKPIFSQNNDLSKPASADNP